MCTMTCEVRAVGVDAPFLLTCFLEESWVSIFHPSSVIRTSYFRMLQDPIGIYRLPIAEI